MNKHIDESEETVWISIHIILHNSEISVFIFPYIDELIQQISETEKQWNKHNGTHWEQNLWELEALIQ